MSEMAPEPQGEPEDVVINYAWQDNALEVEASLGASKVKVEMDWKTESRDPGADLDILLSALPQILIQVHQTIDENEEGPSA